MYSTQSPYRNHFSAIKEALRSGAWERRVEGEKEKLLAVEEALEKLDKGTYGICVECGNPIKSGRLKASPLPKLCVTRQSKLEKEMSLQRRRKNKKLNPQTRIWSGRYGKRRNKSLSILIGKQQDT